MPTVDLNKRRRAIKTTFHDPDFLACFPSQCALIELGLQIQLRQQIREIPLPTHCSSASRSSCQFPYNSGWSVGPFVLWGRHCKPFANGTMRFILAALATNKRQLSTQRQTVAAQSAYTPPPCTPAPLHPRASGNLHPTEEGRACRMSSLICGILLVSFEKQNGKCNRIFCLAPLYYTPCIFREREGGRGSCIEEE